MYYSKFNLDLGEQKEELILNEVKVRGNGNHELKDRKCGEKIQEICFRFNGGCSRRRGTLGYKIRINSFLEGDIYEWKKISFPREWAYSMPEG